MRLTQPIRTIIEDLSTADAQTVELSVFRQETSKLELQAMHIRALYSISMLQSTPSIPDAVLARSVSTATVASISQARASSSSASCTEALSMGATSGSRRTKRKPVMSPKVTRR